MFERQDREVLYGADARHRMVYRLLTLPHAYLFGVARQVGIDTPHDGNYESGDYARELLSRAREGVLLGPLWDAIEQAHAHHDGRLTLYPSDCLGVSNPFHGM